MNKLKNLILLVAMAVCAPMSYAAKSPVALTSPNGKIAADIWIEGQLSYSLKHDGTVLLDKSPIGLIVAGREIGSGIKSTRVTRRNNVEEHIVSPLYRVKEFDVKYNEVTVNLKNGYGVTFRAYDDGLAYRFNTTEKGATVVDNEIVDLNFPADFTTYMAYSTSKPGVDPYAMAFQNLYTEAKITEVNTENIAFLPITVDCGAGVKMTLLESDLEAYPGMFIKGDGKSTSLQGTFAKYPTEMIMTKGRAMTKVAKRADYIAKTEGARTYPWRIWAVTTDDTQMPLNNLVYALASPSRVSDTSWIKPGRVAWDWWNNWGVYNVDFKAGINMDTYKHYIDFAAENGLEFVVLDEGWYAPASGDMLTVIPELNLPELIAYGKSKGVDLILWTVFNVLDDQLEAACKKYSEMGIAGFKVDFLDRDDQTAVEMAYRIADAAARHNLTLDYHGFYKPTGLNRTYPNLINYESVFGMEEVKWSTVEKDMMKYDVMMPYIRMMAGPVDYTPGAMRNATRKDFKPVYYNPMSQGTRCHQLAAYVVHDSPLTMLADNPTIYRREQECTDFIASIPNSDIDETRVLQGKLGESIVVARRVGDNWYVGGLTDWNPRDLSIDFSFLGDGNYDVVLFTDGVNADTQAEDYRKEVFSANSKTVKPIHLASGGGFAMTITKK